MGSHNSKDYLNESKEYVLEDVLLCEICGKDVLKVSFTNDYYETDNDEYVCNVCWPQITQNNLNGTVHIERNGTVFAFKIKNCTHRY